MAEKRYTKLTKELKPDLVSYREDKAKALGGGEEEREALYRNSNSLVYAGREEKPSAEAIDRLVADVHRQESDRSKRSRRRAFNEEEDVTYINERNMKFNKKVSRAFDKNTQEIRDNLERGTAL